MKPDKLKFKAFDKVDKKVYDVIQIYFDDKKVFLEMPDDKIGKRWEYRNFCDVELMQCIGRKDRDGVEVYEGNILGYRNEHLSRTSKIRYDTTHARFVQDITIKFSSKNKPDVKTVRGNLRDLGKLKIIKEHK